MKFVADDSHGGDLRDEVDAGCQALLYHGPEGEGGSGARSECAQPGATLAAPSPLPGRAQPLAQLCPAAAHLAISLATFSLGQVTKAAETDPGT